ncbi:formylglycine-generating enzyme family protein [Achromobacter aloeverae]
MKFESALLAALTLAAATSGAHAAPKWDARYYNPGKDPKAAEGDVILPMPCDGAMAFRKVVVPVGRPMDDYLVNVGEQSPEYPFVTQARQAYIAGSFTEPGKNPSSRYYLMAKYELSVLQYQSLQTLEGDPGKTCPTPEQIKLLPVTGISWFEAQNLANRYSVWLRTQQKNVLPKEDGISGFVRLPTEVEWEFAARGGMGVDSAARAEARYPMDGELRDYEWYGGPQSANGKAQLVGRLKPNPLGLYDMLGNVAEMTSDAFHLSKLDRPHGGTGAYVIRGGDFRSKEADLRSAARREGNYYDEDGDMKDKTVGVRWVVAAPELTSKGRTEQLEKGWAELGSGQVSADAANKGKSAVEELGDLAGKVEDGKLKEQLKDLEGKLRASNLAQEEARDQAIRASLNLGAFLCTKLRDDGRYVQFVQKTYSEVCAATPDAADCAQYKSNIEKRRYELGETTQYYASSLIDAATLYGRENIAKQVPVILKTLEQNEKLKGLMPYLSVYWGNQQAYLKTWKVDKDGWLAACVAAVKN